MGLASTLALLFCGLMFLTVSASDESRTGRKGRTMEGTIAFATVGRTRYAFDVFLLDLPPGFSRDSWINDSSAFGLESRITDGVSVNYNGMLVHASEQCELLRALKYHQCLCFGSNHSQEWILVYISERGGTAEIRFNLFSEQGSGFLGKKPLDSIGDRRIASELDGAVARAFEDLGSLSGFRDVVAVALDDRPAIANGRIVYMSTRESRLQSRQSWSAVYSTDIVTKRTVRLTPENVTDYSPAISPSGKFIMVASNQGRGWGGEMEELDTDLYVLNSADGSERRLVARGGGWPSWSDDSTVFFHRRAQDGWWSIYKLTISEREGPFEAERVTPPGVHAFTPAASRTGKWIALATRRPDSAYRHIEVFELSSKRFYKVTEQDTHHYNPFVSPDSDKIGYHRCRGKTGNSVTPIVEHMKSPVQGLQVVRVDGDFPVVSPDGRYMAFLRDLPKDERGIYVTALDGSAKIKITDQHAFGLSWDRQRKGVLYTSKGAGFKKEDYIVHIASILNVYKIASGEAKGASWKILTKNGTGNNGFPSVSPDGKWLVFRSGRSGHKNLYIMDAVNGEEGSLRRLTEGAWTDTMPNWSPDGNWIAFASDRHYPGGGSFAVYLVHPDGTGLHRILNSSTEGRVNHPFFSPDSKSLVFTTDYAGISAEPISVPGQFQPYGEIFAASIDGSELCRLTHNSYEDGAPSWSPKVSLSPNPGEKIKCKFDESRWLRLDKLFI